MSEPIISKKSSNSADTENIIDDNDSLQKKSRDGTGKSDFPTMIKDFFTSIPWRLSIGMFILLIVLLSKQFTENVLFAIGGEKLVDGDCPTNTGTIVVCLFAALGLIIMDILIRAKLL